MINKIYDAVAGFKGQCLFLPFEFGLTIIFAHHQATLESLNLSIEVMITSTLKWISIWAHIRSSGLSEVVAVSCTWSHSGISCRCEVIYREKRGTSSKRQMTAASAWTQSQSQGCVINISILIRKKSSTPNAALFVYANSGRWMAMAMGKCVCLSVYIKKHLFTAWTTVIFFSSAVFEKHKASAVTVILASGVRSAFRCAMLFSFRQTSYWRRPFHCLSLDASWWLDCPVRYWQLPSFLSIPPSRHLTI